ncbi:MAG TPA: FtsX-like permease family protein [Candidatus Saccharimonadales bacterium]|nr:FtsX-like permease family protein [Candidatus Saccharimonadales bacterium]
MHISDGLRRSGRSLRLAKARTILTVIAISVGALALALTLAAGQGAKDFTNRLISTNFNPSIIYVVKSDTSQTINALSGNNKPQRYNPSQSSSSKNLLTSADLPKIANAGNITRVAPALSLTPSYVTASGANKYDVQVQSDEIGAKYRIIAGKVPTFLEGNQAVIPQAYAAILKLGPDNRSILGKMFTVHYVNDAGQGLDQQYKVVAISQTSSGLFGGTSDILISESASQEAYSFQTGQQLGDEQFPAAIAYAKKTDDVSMLLTANAVAAQGPYAAESAKDLANQITSVINIIQYAVAGFGALALLVSVFGIINTQLISVLERTKEIGLMKALGMSARGVLGLFVFEAAWIGFWGGVVGIVLAYVISLYANPWINNRLNLGGNLLVFKPEPIIALVIGLMLVAALAGLAPAWKASKMNPIEALRTE